MVAKRWFSAILCLIICGTMIAKGEEPVVRTEKDLEQGRENVKQVIEELRTLLEDNEKNVLISNAKKRKPLAPPYSKIISGNNGQSTLVFRPRFTTSKAMANALDGVIPVSTLIESLPEQNMLVINAPAKDVESYREILTAMDIPAPQILIEAKVVEVTFTDAMERNLSIDWTGRHMGMGARTEVPGVNSQPETGLNGSFTPIRGSNTMKIAFNWLMKAQDAKVLSSPNILISRNEVSRIVTGEDIPIQEANTVSNSLSITTKFKSVGVQLEVEPSMINHDNVTLRVYPQVSNVASWESISTGSGVGSATYAVPKIAVRSLETHLKMQDKEVAMMGGLYSSSKTLQQQRVPILSDLPWIGELFTGKNDVNEIKQLVFFLKVHIIPPDGDGNNLYFDPDKNAKISEQLGEVLKNSESFPMHRTSVERTYEEIKNAGPGYEARKRDEFRRSDPSVKAQGESLPPAPEKK